jgi:hypothetical protein
MAPRNVTIDADGNVGSPRPVNAGTYTGNTNSYYGAPSQSGGVSGGGGYGSPFEATEPTTPPVAGTESNFWRDYFRGQMNNFNRPAIDYQTGNQDQARLQQMQVIQDLQRQAAGDPNSMAQQQLRQGYGAAQAQQSSLGSTMRGQSAGAAMRGINQGQQGIQRGYAGDQQMLQAQEQQAAQAMLAQLLAQQQGQDINQATMMGQGTLASFGMDDAMRQFYTGGSIQQDIAATERGNNVARAQMGFNDYNAALGRDLVNSGLQAGATAVGTYGTMGSNQNKAANTTDTLMGSNPSEWSNPYPYR